MNPSAPSIAFGRSVYYCSILRDAARLFPPFFSSRPTVRLYQCQRRLSVVFEYSTLAISLSLSQCGKFKTVRSSQARSATSRSSCRRGAIARCPSSTWPTSRPPPLRIPPPIDLRHDYSSCLAKETGGNEGEVSSLRKFTGKRPDVTKDLEPSDRIKVPAKETHTLPKSDNVVPS